ncbi:MAG: DUF3991 domain-containing protein [Cytophagaceae bacterium]|nr:MAG: DUF3991 domain-containing protein [Cytophagaceae bacterium]
MAGYSILHFEKTKTFGDLKRLAAHHERSGSDVSNAKPPYDSRVFTGSGDMVSDVENRLPKKYRSDAVLAIEIMLTTSPESQRKNDDLAESWDEEKVKKFTLAARSFLEKEFGSAVTSRIHFDETTPHVQGFIVPNEGWESGKTLNAKKLFSPRTLVEFHTRWNAACVAAGLDVQRGEPGSQAHHEPIAKYYGRVNAPIPKPPGLSEKPPEPTAVDKLKEAVGVETSHKKAVVLREKSEQERVDFLEKDYIRLTQKANESAAAEKRASQRASKAEAKLQGLKNQSQELRSLPLAKVLEMLGCERHPEQKLRYRTPAGDVWIEQNDGPKFNSFDDEAIKGRGAIDLVMKINGCDFGQATSFLASHYGVEHTQHDAAGYLAAKAPEAVEKALQAHPEPSALPVPHPGRLERVTAYLTATRGIPAALVSSLVELGRVYADKFSNVVFLTDDGKGCEIRGTGTTPFHGQRGPKTGHTVSGDPSKVVIVESAIEALSCTSMTGMTAVSTGGANLARAVEIARSWLSKGATVFAGQNSDLDGEKQALKLMEQVPEVHRLPPRLKASDWNDALQMEQAKTDQPSVANRLLNTLRK